MAYKYRSVIDKGSKGNLIEIEAEKGAGIRSGEGEAG